VYFAERLLINDLKKLNVPEDFNDENAYNLIQYAFRLMVTSGQTAEEINSKLHQHVEDATDNFFKEVAKQ
jgi:hypothetical protein